MTTFPMTVLGLRVIRLVLTLLVASGIVFSVASSKRPRILRLLDRPLSRATTMESDAILSD